MQLKKMSTFEFIEFENTSDHILEIQKNLYILQIPTPFPQILSRPMKVCLLYCQWAGRKIFFKPIFNLDSIRRRCITK